MENELDRLIENHLKEKRLKMQGFSLQACPEEPEIAGFLEGDLPVEKQNQIREHISRCERCLFLLATAQEAEKKTEEMPSVEMIRRAKDIAEPRSKKSLLNYKWQILSAGSFVFSFAFAKYFAQFLVLAVIFSLKWLLDSGSRRSLTMIYQAWRKKDKNSAERIFEDSKNRIKQDTLNS